MHQLCSAVNYEVVVIYNFQISVVKQLTPCDQALLNQT